MPLQQAPKWVGEQVRDRNDYKRASRVHNQQAASYEDWYKKKQAEKAASEPQSTALGVNRLSPNTNKVGHAMCMNVKDKADVEAQKRGAFEDKWANSWSDQRQKDGHRLAKDFAMKSAVEHKEQAKKHHRASKGAIVGYPENHDPEKWRDDIERSLEAAAEEKQIALQAPAKTPVFDTEGFQLAMNKRGRGSRR